MKGVNRYINILVEKKQKKIHLGQPGLSSLSTIFYCLIEHGQIEPGHS